MADDKNHASHPGSGCSGTPHSASGGPPNWLFGLDKLTTPSLDYLGIKLRDKLRSWLNEKARERALLRRAEKEFLYRQLDLVDYGADQYAALLENIVETLLEQHFRTVAPLVHFAVNSSNIAPERAFECLTEGYQRQWDPGTLAGGELILFCAACGTLDIIVAVHTAKMMFQYANVPASVHLNNPAISDADLEALMQDERTLAAVGEAIRTSHEGIASVVSPK